MALANKLLSLEDLVGIYRWSKREELETTAEMDQACLQLCISLLDHTLHRDYFKSVVLSFLAVLAINEKLDNVFRSP